MAVATSTSYFSNAIVGQPMVGADIDIHQVDKTPRFQVGFGFIRADGNKYRYCHFGETTNRGVLVATNLGETSTAAFATNVGATVANITRPEGQIMDPNAIGSHYIQLTLGSAVVNQYAGAYASVTSGTGLGYTYRVKGSTKTGDPVSGDCYLELYKPLVVAIDSNTGIVVGGCKFSDVEPADPTDPIVIGATVSGVTDTNYAWVCTKGITTVLQDANVGTVGQVAFLASSTAGAVMALSATVANNSLNQVVGQFVVAASSGNYALVTLSLE